MNIIEKYPAIQDALLECRDKVEAITGKKVTIDFKFKFHYLSTDMLATIICNVCEVKWFEVIGQSRKANIVLARHLFCYFAAELQKKTLWSIAHTLHRNDHSTIVHARNKVVKMRETEDELYMPAILEVEKQINEYLQ